MDWSTRYRAAFEACQPQMKPLQSDILNALYHAPEQRLTASMIARSFQRGVSQINYAFGRLGHQVHDLLGGHPEDLKDGTYQWFRILAQGEQTAYGFSWNLRPEVAFAMEVVGLVASLPVLPDGTGAECLYEGNAYQRSVLRYERNRAARNQCREIFGHECIICGFDFGIVYGPVAADYIEVHHLERLSEAKGRREVNPRRDLRPVCANCHAVLHRRTPPYTIKEMKAFLKA